MNASDFGTLRDAVVSGIDALTAADEALNHHYRLIGSICVATNSAPSDDQRTRAAKLETAYETARIRSSESLTAFTAEWTKEAA